MTLLGLKSIATSGSYFTPLSTGSPLIKREKRVSQPEFFSPSTNTIFIRLNISHLYSLFTWFSSFLYSHPYQLTVKHFHLYLVRVYSRAHSSAEMKKAEEMPGPSSLQCFCFSPLCAIRPLVRTCVVLISSRVAQREHNKR